MGNKAFNLSQLLQRSYPVVAGFVVPASTFRKFLESLGESQPLLADWPHSSLYLNVDNPRQLQLVAQEIRQKIMAAALPPALASAIATAAEALQAPAMILHPSVWLLSKSSEVSRELPAERLYNVEDALQVGNLQVKSSDQPSNVQSLEILESHTCFSHPEALTLGLKRVWAELFRAKSLFYWQRHGIGLQQLNMGVLVQPVWDAIASGILRADSAELNIQATWGIGRALTKGEVLPDSYQLQAETGTVKTRRLGSKTRAYRLGNQQELFTLNESGLQTYLLSEEQQKQYALEEKYLKQLIEVSQELATELNSAFFLEWTIYQTPGESEPQLYLTQLTPQPSKKAEVSREVPVQRPYKDQGSNLQPSPQLIRGLPAAGGRVTAPAQVMVSNYESLQTMIPGRILIAQSISPDWLPFLKQAAAIVTEQGGMTCHGAIIARELGIPAVVSAPGVTQLIQTGESLRVDGDQGEIHRLGIEKSLPVSRDVLGENLYKAEGSNEGEATSPTLQQPLPEMRTPTQHFDPSYAQPEGFRPMENNLQSPVAITTQLLVNLSQPNSLERIVGLPLDGVGLLRSELMMIDALENLHPNEWLRQGLKHELVARLAQLILQFAAAFAPRPVYYRSLDWRSHEFQLITGDTSLLEPEVNPALGLRGTRRYLIDPTSFDLELAALGQVYACGYTNVHLLLPFVRSVEEFAFCRRRVELTALIDNPHFQLWIMAEVPSVLFLLPDYVKAGVQGISIGTNDLTQLLLAADRDQRQLGSTLDARHPAVMRAIKHLIQTARQQGIPCSICGQAPAQFPELIDSFVQWGVSSISVDLNDVQRTYSAIARAEQRLLLDAARQRFND